MLGAGKLWHANERWRIQAILLQAQAGLAVIVRLPLKLASLANERAHWSIKARRAKEQRKAACYATFPLKLAPPPWIVTITRVGKRKLDSDNLAISAKHVRDGIADRLGMDDGDPRIEWRYQQRIGKDYAVEIEVTTKE